MTPGLESGAAQAPFQHLPAAADADAADVADVAAGADVADVAAVPSRFPIRWRQLVAAAAAVQRWSSVWSAAGC